MPLTLKDIAEMVGVAESTVSRAINNKPGVGEETKKKILEIARKYNYRPNQLARGLARKQTNMIALLLHDLEHPGYTEIIKNVEEVANSKDYQLILCNTDNKVEKEESYFELIHQNIVDGAIIVGGELADKHILNLALDKKAPIVLINRLAEELLIPTILIDNAAGGYLATDHLCQQGLKNIALIMGAGNDFLESEKMAGYQQALKEHNIPFANDFVIETNGSRQAGFQAFLELMELPEPPAGFFVTRDLLAIGLVEAIKMGGYLIPSDFSVVTYGESLISSVIDPPLTVISEPLAESGKLAASFLIDMINERETKDLIQVLKPEIKVRESSLPQFNNK